MAHPVLLIALIAGALIYPAMSVASDKPPRTGSTVKEVKAMPATEQTALALSAAPAHISNNAGAMIFGADGKLTETRKSTNGFTCIPTIMNLPDPDRKSTRLNSSHRT